MSDSITERYRLGNYFKCMRQIFRNLYQIMIGQKQLTYFYFNKNYNSQKFLSIIKKLKQNDEKYWINFLYVVYKETDGSTKPFQFLKSISPFKKDIIFFDYQKNIELLQKLGYENVESNFIAINQKKFKKMIKTFKKEFVL